MKFKYYCLNILIGIDQLFNTFLAGDPDETLSSRAYRMQEKKQTTWKWLAGFIDFLFLPFGQRDHCYKAWLYEIERMNSPKDLGNPDAFNQSKNLS